MVNWEVHVDFALYLTYPNLDDDTYDNLLDKTWLKIWDNFTYPYEVTRLLQTPLKYSKSLTFSILFFINKLFRNKGNFRTFKKFMGIKVFYLFYHLI